MGQRQFRNVAFGGFHKQDVLNYIESTTQRHNAEVVQLRAERESAAAGQAEAERRLQESNLRAQQLRENLRACAASLGAVRAELAEKKESMKQIERYAQTLSRQVEEMVPLAQAYETVRGREAGIEMGARRRAQTILDGAGRQAETSRAQVGQWMSRVQEDYDRLRTDVDATMAHTVGELDRVCKSLEWVAREFAEHDAEMEELLRLAREMGRENPAVPSPLPIREEPAAEEGWMPPERKVVSPAAEAPEKPEAPEAAPEEQAAPVSEPERKEEQAPAAAPEPEQKEEQAPAGSAAAPEQAAEIPPTAEEKAPADEAKETPTGETPKELTPEEAAAQEAAAKAREAEIDAVLAEARRLLGLPLPGEQAEEKATFAPQEEKEQEGEHGAGMEPDHG